MRFNHLTLIGLAAFAILKAAEAAHGQNSANAKLELTFTLTAVEITDTLTGNSMPATFETSTGVGDIVFEDIGPNGNTYTGGSPSNPIGSIGSGTAEEKVLLNGLDPFVDDYDLDSFGIGDSLVSTMTVSATATTPGSVFFGQVSSDNTLYFSTYGSDTDRFTFYFDYTAVITGNLDSSWMPGVTLGFGDGDEVNATADTTLAGPPSSFVVASNYFDIGYYNTSNTAVPLNDATSGSLVVEFAPGDNSLRITFLSNLVVNAEVASIPEPSSAVLALFSLPVICCMWRRHR